MDLKEALTYVNADERKEALSLIKDRLEQIFADPHNLDLLKLEASTFSQSNIDVLMSALGFELTSGIYELKPSASAWTKLKEAVTLIAQEFARMEESNSQTNEKSQASTDDNEPNNDGKADVAGDYSAPSGPVIYNKTVYKEPPDHSCLFHSLARQIYNLDKPSKEKAYQLRQEIADWEEINFPNEEYSMISAAKRKELEDALRGLVNLNDRRSIARYIAKVRQRNFWGGGVEALVASYLFNRPVRVYISTADVVAEELNPLNSTAHPIGIVHVHGNHWNSVVHTPSTDGKSVTTYESKRQSGRTIQPSSPIGSKPDLYRSVSQRDTALVTLISMGVDIERASNLLIAYDWDLDKLLQSETF